jgi:hypothetical protein
MEIVVIGTEPPCIRCHTTFKRAEEVARASPGKIVVKKAAIHTKEVEKYGKVEGGHTIGEVGKIRPDFESMKKLLMELDALKTDEAKNERRIDTKLKELEKVLEPVKKKAKELGYLMTPVLVINGEVKSMDYVPSKEEIRAWIEIELKK